MTEEEKILTAAKEAYHAIHNVFLNSQEGMPNESPKVLLDALLLVAINLIFGTAANKEAVKNIASDFCIKLAMNVMDNIHQYQDFEKWREINIH